MIALATLPKTRPAIAEINNKISRTVPAYTAVATSRYAVGTDDIRKKLLSISESSIPLPSASPDSVDPVNTGSIAKPTKLAMLRKPTGWQIQIGATPDRKSAKKLLAKARSKATKTLSSKSNYLEPVAKGGTTLIRARFVGFPSKTAARNACKYLKKRKFACLAINN